MRGVRPIVCAVVALAAVLSAGCATGVRRQGVDAGFLFSRDAALDGVPRLRLAGPLFETQCSTGRTFAALRPFYSEREDPVGERLSRYFLWPVASFHERWNETSWRFLLLFGHDFDSAEPGSRFKLFLLPFFFAGRDAQREPYAALFPLGGVIRDFLGQDRISFFLFPLYCHSSVNQTHSWHVLWPFFSRTEGPGVHRLGVFPFYGRSEQEGKWSKRYVLWPLWTQAEYAYSNSSGNAWMLWPALGRVSLDNQSSWLVLPPFFRWTRTADRVAFYGPWPFFQYGSGEKELLYLWPLWGRSRDKDERSGFALWPIVRWGGVMRGKEETRWFDVAPVLHYGIRAPVATNGTDTVEVSARNVRVWPLFSYYRDGNASRFRFVELWPLPPAPGVEQNWSPLWTLYQSVRWEDAGEDELLWGLCRRRKGPEGWSLSVFPLVSASGGGDGTKSEWSLLRGLFGYSRGGSGGVFRLLYFIHLRTGGAKESKDKTS